MLILKSTSAVPMNDGKYFGKITGDLVDANVKVADDIFYNVSFPVDGEVNGKDVPAVIVVKDAYASVHVED